VGAADIAEDLVESHQFNAQDLYTKARVRRETELIEHLNPLELATFQTWYPPEKLTILMPFAYGRGSFFEVIRSMIREEKRSAVSRLLDGIEQSADEENNPTGRELKHKIKMEALKRRGQYSKLCRKRGHSMIGFMAEVLTRAPKVAAQILDLLTGRPYVKRTNVTRHPLPFTSDLTSRDHIGRLLGHKDPMITAYECDYMDQDLAYQGMLSTYAKECKYRPLGIPEWKFDTRNNLVPEWHRTFAPTERHHHTACQVLVLMLPNILDMRIVHALNISANVDVWAYPACQCINYHLWAHVVHRAYYLRLIYEVVLAVMLTIRSVLRDGDVRLPPEERYDNLHDTFWSFCMSMILSAGIREFFMLCHRFYSHTRYYRLPVAAFFSRKSDVVLTLPQWAFETLLFTLLFLYAYFAMTELELEAPSATKGLDQQDFTSPEEHKFHADFSFLPQRAFAGSFNLLFLVLNTLVRWVHVLTLLRGASGLGERFLAIIHSFKPMAEIILILVFGIMALVSATLAFRGNAPVKKIIFWVVFGVFCGDGSALYNIMKLDRDLFRGWVSMVVVSCLLVLMTLFLMNLIIGVFGQAYTECEDMKRLYFLRSRNLLCEQFLLEPQWPRAAAPAPVSPNSDQGSDDSDDNEENAFAGRTRGLLFGMHSGRQALCRWRLPEVFMQRKWLVCVGLFIMWFVSEVTLPPRRWLVIVQGLILAFFEISLQAACMQNDIMDADILLNGLEPEDKDDEELDQSEPESDYDEEEEEDSETKSLKEKCLWMCLRADFDKDFYDHDATEMRESISTLKENIKDVGGRLEALMEQVEGLSRRR